MPKNVHYTRVLLKNIEIHLSVTLMNKERFLDFRRFFGSFVFVNLTKNGFRSGKRHILTLDFDRTISDLFKS